VDFQDAHMGGVIRVLDPEVLNRAAELDRILISHDRQTMLAHFARFLTRRSSPGLIIVSQDLDIGAVSPAFTSGHSVNKPRRQ
jgi:hypothetical protein